MMIKGRGNCEDVIWRKHCEEAEQLRKKLILVGVMSTTEDFEGINVEELTESQASRRRYHS